jgi:CHASE2 domain-containing protein
MSDEKTDPGFGVSWATNVLVGLIVALALCLTHDLPPLQHLERIGGDFAMQQYAHDDRVLLPPIVILLIDEPTKVAWAEGGGTIGDRLIDLIRLVRHDGSKQQQPRRVRTVILDVQIQDTVAEKIQKALMAELKQPGPRVVLPLQELRPTQGEAAWEALSDRFDRDGVSKQPHIVRGLSLLSPDEDDRVVRHLTTKMCILRHLPAETGGEGKEVIAWRWVPTLAEAAANNPNEEKCEPGQQKREEDRVMLFRATAATGVIEAGKFITLSAGEMIDKDGHIIASTRNLALLTEANVLIGQTHTATWTDQHLTPIGPMSGVFVHANALFTLLLKNKPHDVSTFWYELTAIVVSGLFFAAMSSVTNAFIGWLKWGEFSAAVLRIFALVVVGFVAAHGLRMLWGSVAASALREGNVIGTFVPVLAVGLETVLEAGKLLITGIHEAIHRIILVYKLIKAIYKAVAAYMVLTITILTLTAASALAQDKVGTLTVTQERAEVEIVRRNQSIKPIGLSSDLYPFDVIIVHGRNDAVIDRYGHPPQVLHGPASFLVSPPTRSGVAGFWDNFWQQPVVQPVVQPGITSVPGITPVPRSGHDGTTPDVIAILTFGGDIGRPLPIRGPMRALSAFTDARFLKTDGSGLALAWAGGTPPYEVVMETEDGVALTQFASPAPFLWQPGWQMPNTVVRLRIYDGNDRVVRTELRSSIAAPALENNDPVAGPVELYQKYPAWRYEALRMLANAAAHNPQAAQAVLAIRLSE